MHCIFQYVKLADVIGKQQHKLRVHLMALFERELAVRVNQRLVELVRELTLEQSHQMNAKLVLLLANHIGNLDVLKDAMQRAKP